VKRCPTCLRSYADNTLRFCLEDGTELSIVDERTGDDPQRTEKFPAAVTQAAHDAVRVNIPTSQTGAPLPAAQPTKSSSLVLKILVGIVAMAVIVVVAAAGLLGLFYYLGRSGVVYNPTPTPVPTFSPSPYDIVLNQRDDQTLEDKIKELQKKLEQADGANSDTDIPWNADDLPNMGRTAKVNSPNDGFLALRNLPSTEIGSLIAKIPHGTTINVLLCSEQTVTVGGRNGHWCMVSYDKKTGWVFDVWLSFATDSKN
jgi:hypothetical protein